MVYDFDAVFSDDADQVERAMPRIAASIAAFVVIAFSIGFNMVRYPIVWDLVGASSDLSQPSESSRSAAILEPLAPVQPDVLPEPTTPWQAARPGDAWDDPTGGTVYRNTSSEVDDEPFTPSVDAVDSSLAGARWQGDGYRRSWQPAEDSLQPTKEECDADGCDLSAPVHFAASEKYPSDADRASTPAAAGVRQRLVPVIRPDDQREPAGSSGIEQRTHRLPQVDQVHRAAADREVPPSAQGPVPFYPSTGIEDADERPDVRSVGRFQ